MSRWIAAALIAVIATASPVVAQMRLLMLDQVACEWCDLWDAEVGVVYAKTTEGKQAPLLRTRISGPLPEGVTLVRRASYTPTFVLLKDGAEIGRIEGYPGEDFFYGMLQQLLERAEGPKKGS